jgi:two-component system NarL family sensor kinase
MTGDRRADHPPWPDPYPSAYPSADPAGELLLAAASALGRARSAAGVLAAACRAAYDTTGRPCRAYLLDGDVLRPAGAAGAEPARTAPVLLGEGLVGLAVARECALTVRDSGRDARCPPGPAASVTVFPLGRPAVGALEVLGPVNLAPQGRELSALRALASLVATAVREHLLTAEVAGARRESERVVAGLTELQEQERRRLAAELHDGLSQRVVSLAFHLTAAAEAAGDEPFVAAQVAAARELAAAALEETRAAIGGLRPPALDDLGLAAAVEGLARGLPQVSTEVVGSAEGLAGAVETTVFRIAQEALQNALKYAPGARVTLTLHIGPDAVSLRVSDDGPGFDLADASGGFGLRSIRERAESLGGTAHVTSRPGYGTTVNVHVPAAGATYPRRARARRRAQPSPGPHDG